MFFTKLEDSPSGFPFAIHSIPFPLTLRAKNMIPKYTIKRSFEEEEDTTKEKVKKK